MTKFFKSNLSFFLLSTVIIFIVYGKAVNFGITNLDDDTLITRNIKYISNLKNVPKFFLTDCYFKKQTQYYRPVLNISFAIEAFFIKNDLRLYHADNILLYILALFIIFVFLSQLNFNKTILKFLILLFAVHPALSSVPVWLPARNDILLTIFFLSSLIGFINYVKTNKVKFLILHLLFFLLSLFTKETAVLLIFVYPLIIYCFNLKINKKQIIINLFFIIPILIIYFILRHYAVRTVDLSMYFNNYSYYIKNTILGIMLYIEKIIYPTNMPIMLYNLKPTLQTYIVSISCIIIFTFYFFKDKANRKNLIFAVLFSFLAILPTFAQEEYAFLTHRLITSLAGILIILTLALEKLIIKYNKIKKYLFIIFIFIFILFSFCSFIQIDKYKDSFTYFKSAYKDAPDYHIVCELLAKEYANNEQTLELAKELVLKSIRLNKNFENCLTFSTILIKAKDLELSKHILYQLLELNNNNRLVYLNLSKIFLLEQNFEKAIEYAKKSTEYDNTIDEKIATFENLAKIYSVSGQYNNAINILKELLKYDNNNAEYYYLLSMLYEDLTDLNNSNIYINEAIKLKPNNENYINQRKNIESKLSTK